SRSCRLAGRSGGSPSHHESPLPVVVEGSVVIFEPQAGAETGWSATHRQGGARFHAWHENPEARLSRGTAERCRRGGRQFRVQLRNRNRLARRRREPRPSVDWWFARCPVRCVCNPPVDPFWNRTDPVGSPSGGAGGQFIAARALAMSRSSTGSTSPAIAAARSSASRAVRGFTRAGYGGARHSNASSYNSMTLVIER